MTKQADLLFMSCAAFGDLYYHNVYSFYGEPVIFTAQNSFSQLFFCYSLGCDGELERWLITPLSAERAIQLEQKDIPIIKAISASKQDYVLLISINIDNGEQSESWKKFSDLDFLMPESDVFISENVNWDGKRKHTHKIRISKEGESDIFASYIGNLTGAFTDFFRNFLDSHDIKSNFFPKDAVPGSFVFRVKTDNVEQLRSEGYQLLEKFSNRKDFIGLLEQRKIDLRLLRRLFDIQLERKLNIELIDEESTESVFSLNLSQINEYLSEVDIRLSSYLNSTMVPQADSFESIRSYLQLLHDNGVVTESSFGKTERQVSYYRDACRLLSLIHDYNTLTPVGIKAINAEDEETFVQIIRTQFENTDCCSIWMVKQQVDSVIEIDENSAADFLIENCSGLSENTARRRSQTLVAWIKKFKEFA